MPAAGYTSGSAVAGVLASLAVQKALCSVCHLLMQACGRDERQSAARKRGGSDVRLCAGEVCQAQGRYAAKVSQRISVSKQRW